jgi:hypothetical protein
MRKSSDMCSDERLPHAAAPNGRHGKDQDDHSTDRMPTFLSYFKLGYYQNVIVGTAGLFIPVL